MGDQTGSRKQSRRLGRKAADQWRMEVDMALGEGVELPSGMPPDVPITAC